MAMESFVSAFKQVDTDNDGVIDIDDLQVYCDKNNLSNKFVAKWLTLFDHDNDNVIHYEEFCRVLGMVEKKPEEVITVQVARQQESAPDGNSREPEIIVYEKEMSDKLRDEVFRIVRQHYDPGDDDADLPTGVMIDICNDLNAAHEPEWSIAKAQEDTKLKNTKHSSEGAIIYSPNSGQTRLLVWRSPPRRAGCCNFCCI